MSKKNRNRAPKEETPVNEQESKVVTEETDAEVTAPAETTETETTETSEVSGAPAEENDQPPAEEPAVPAAEEAEATAVAAEEEQTDAPAPPAEEQTEEEPAEEEVEALSPEQVKMESYIHRLVGLMARAQDANTRYAAGMEFMRACDEILMNNKDGKTGALISAFVGGMKEGGLGEESIVGLLSSPKFSAGQREYIKIAAMLFFSGATKAGRDQIVKQFSVQKIISIVGDQRGATVSKWLGVN